MRNPFRLKNLDLRFLPALALALALLAASHPTRASLAVGAAGLTLGLAMRIWAVGHLVKTERFTASGPYAHLRHPLYAGTLMIGLGLSAMLGGWPAALGAAGLIAWFAIRYLPRKERVETARMLARHGEPYARYRDEVPALWPRWRPWRFAAAGGDAATARWRIAHFDANNELGTLIAVAIAVAAIALRAALG